MLTAGPLAQSSPEGCPWRRPLFAIMFLQVCLEVGRSRMPLDCTEKPHELIDSTKLNRKFGYVLVPRQCEDRRDNKGEGGSAPRHGRRGMDRVKDVTPTPSGGRRSQRSAAGAVFCAGVTRYAEPIGSATPAPRRDPQNTASRARPCRCGTP